MAVLAVLTAVSAASAEPLDPAASSQPLPPQGDIAKTWQPRWGLLIGGIAITGAFYAIPCSAVREAKLCVPVVGPIKEGRDRLVTGETAYGLFDVMAFWSLGFFQATGIGLMTIGLIGKSSSPSPPRVGLALAPRPSGTGADLQVVGQW